MVGIHEPGVCYRLGIAKKGDCGGGTNYSSTAHSIHIDTS